MRAGRAVELEDARLISWYLCSFTEIICNNRETIRQNSVAFVRIDADMRVQLIETH